MSSTMKIHKNYHTFQKKTGSLKKANMNLLFRMRESHNYQESPRFTVIASHNEGLKVGELQHHTIDSHGGALKARVGALGTQFPFDPENKGRFFREEKQRVEIGKAPHYMTCLAWPGLHAVSQENTDKYNAVIQGCPGSQDQGAWASQLQKNSL